MSPDVSYSGELQNLHMKLRKGLDLYSNVVHVVSWPGVASRHKNIDIVIIRELTEGEYSALEHESVDVRQKFFCLLPKLACIYYFNVFRVLLNV